MEFLKEVFGSEALTYDQLAEKLSGNKAIKLANLAGGSYISREKFAALEQERDGLKSQLGEANAKIEEFKGMDIDGIRAAADEWKTKYDTDTAALQQQLAEKDYSYSVREAVGGMKFTSESAKRAFIADLSLKKLPLQDGKLLGLDDFVKSYKESDPDAFVPEGGVPKLVLGGGYKPTVAELTRDQYQKMGYLDRLKLKKEQPELYNELSAK